MKAQTLLFSFFLTLTLFSPSFGQPDILRLSFPVQSNGDVILNPFTGGLNNPQPSKVDLNNDGVEDLFVFDRAGNIPMTFLHSGIPGEAVYTFAPEYAENFPPLFNWVLLRDYNGDGIQDIFAHYPTPVQGIQVWTGYYDAEDRIAFEQFQFCCEAFNIIYYTLTNGSTTQVYVSPVDFPAFNDVDGDGDLDILTFGIGGGYVEYFQNRSIQLGFGKDSLIFKRQDPCWGKFYEASFSEEIVLSNISTQCATGILGDPLVDTRHPGSTLVTFDADDDGDLEVVIGDVNFAKVNYLSNGGTVNNAFMTGQDADFPGYDVPVDIPIFPVPFYFDLNNDGKDDFLAAPNQIGGTPNYEVLWYYENINTAEEPLFELVQKNALTDEMLDFGTGSHPVFLDFNADGLRDILVGTEGYYDESFASNRDPRLVLLLNTGTETEPTFEVADEDFLGLSQYGDNTWNFAPTLGDMDKDGDMDLLVGEQDGKIFYSENLAGAGNPMQFGPLDLNWMGIDVGLNSHPAVADLNRDGLPDLVIGERNGNFNFFPNIGAAGAPAFQSDVTLAPNNQLLGNVSTELPADLSAGNSAPFLIDYGDSFLMFAGSQAGPVQVYGDIENNLGGTFTLLDPNYGGMLEGKRSAVALADLNDDQFFELLVGNTRGGLSMFSTPLDAAEPLSVFAAPDIRPARIFPNPSGDKVTLEWKGDGVGSVELRLWDMWGRALSAHTASGARWTLDLTSYPSGIYLLEISNTAGKRVWEKVAVGR